MAALSSRSWFSVSLLLAPTLVTAFAASRLMQPPNRLITNLTRRLRSTRDGLFRSHHRSHHRHRLYLCGRNLRAGSADLSAAKVIPNRVLTRTMAERRSRSSFQEPLPSLAYEKASATPAADRSSDCLSEPDKERALCSLDGGWQIWLCRCRDQKSARPRRK